MRAREITQARRHSARQDRRGRRLAGWTCCGAEGQRESPMATRYIATVEGEEHELEVEELAVNSIRLKIGKIEFEADVRRVSDSSYSILVNNRSFDFEVVAEGAELIVPSPRGASLFPP